MKIRQAYQNEELKRQIEARDEIDDEALYQRLGEYIAAIEVAGSWAAAKPYIVAALKELAGLQNTLATAAGARPPNPPQRGIPPW